MKTTDLSKRAEEIESEAGDLRAILGTLGRLVELSHGIEENDSYGLAYLLQLLSREADRVSNLGDDLRVDLQDVVSPEGAAS